VPSPGAEFVAADGAAARNHHRDGVRRAPSPVWRSPRRFRLARWGYPLSGSREQGSCLPAMDTRGGDVLYTILIILLIVFVALLIWRMVGGRRTI